MEVSSWSAQKGSIFHWCVWLPEGCDEFASQAQENSFWAADHVNLLHHSATPRSKKVVFTSSPTFPPTHIYSRGCASQLLSGWQSQYSLSRHCYLCYQPFTKRNAPSRRGGSKVGKLVYFTRSICGYLWRMVGLSYIYIHIFTCTHIYI